MAKELYTKEEVEKMLLSLMVFSSANGNQGLKAVYGPVFLSKVRHIMTVVEHNKNQSILSLCSLYNPTLNNF